MTPERIAEIRAEINKKEPWGPFVPTIIGELLTEVERLKRLWDDEEETARRIGLDHLALVEENARLRAELGLIAAALAGGTVEA